MSTDNTLTDSEDEDWDPAHDSGGETDDDEFTAPTDSWDELLLNLPAKEIALGTWGGHECTKSSGNSMGALSPRWIVPRCHGRLTGRLPGRSARPRSGAVCV
jgi:hypothetical protein